MNKLTLILVILISGITLTSSSAPGSDTPKATQTPEQRIDSLIHVLKNNDLDYLLAGNKKFLEGDSVRYSNKKIISEMAHGKMIRAVVFTCSDARLTPEFIFNTQPGELYVVQNPGAVLDSSSVAGIEYAATQLGVELVIILGHNRCSEINTAMKNNYVSDNFDHIIATLKPIMDRVSRDKVPYNQEWDSVQVRNVIYDVNYLVETSLPLHDRMSMKRLTIVGAYLDLETGKVDLIDIKSAKLDQTLKIYHR